MCTFRKRRFLFCSIRIALLSCTTLILTTQSQYLQFTINLYHCERIYYKNHSLSNNHTRLIIKSPDIQLCIYDVTKLGQRNYERIE